MFSIEINIFTKFNIVCVRACVRFDIFLDQIQYQVDMQTYLKQYYFNFTASKEVFTYLRIRARGE